MSNRTLSSLELRELVTTLADRPHLWQERVSWNADERCYTRISANEDVEIWLITWMDGHDTGFHDHDDSAAAITVVEGALVDERLAIGGQPIATRHEAGATFEVAPAAIHRVRHPGGAPAVTLHAYSPPLARMGSYEIGEDGSLLRHARSGGERLEEAPAAV